MPDLDPRDAPAPMAVDDRHSQYRVLADHEVNPRLVDALPRTTDLHAGPGPIVDPETGRPLPPFFADPDPRYPSDGNRRRFELMAEHHERTAGMYRQMASAAPPPANRPYIAPTPVAPPAEVVVP